MQGTDVDVRAELRVKVNFEVGKLNLLVVVHTVQGSLRKTTVQNSTVVFLTTTTLAGCLGAIQGTVS